MSGQGWVIKWLSASLLVLLLIRPASAQPYAAADSATLSEGWFNLGTRHLISKDWRPALLAFRRALHYKPDETHRAAIHQNLGSLHFLLSDYQKAIIHFDYAYKLVHGLPSQQAREAEICLNLGFTMLETGFPHKASDWFDRVFVLNLKDHDRWRRSLALGTGNVCFSKGSFREAIRIYSTALLESDLSKEVSQEEIWLMKNLAWSFQIFGEFDSAGFILDQALERIIFSGMKDNFVLGEIMLQKSLLLSASGNLSGALLVLEEALEQVLAEDVIHIDSSRKGQGYTTKDVLIYSILYEKVRLRYNLIKRVEPDNGFIQSVFGQAMALLQLGEDLVCCDRLNELVSIQSDIQRAIAGIALELIPQLNRNSDWQVETMVRLTERLEWFEESCRQVSVIEVDTLTDTSLSQLIGLKRRLFRLHKQRFLEESDIPIPENDLPDEGVNALEKLYRFNESRENRSPARLTGNHHYLVCTDSSALSTIQCLLHKDEAVIKYLIFDTTLYAMLFSTDTVVIHRSSMGDDVDMETQACIKTLKGLNVSAFNKYSLSLYHHLISPVKEQLKSKAVLRIVPDRLLQELPFDALLVDDTGEIVPSVTYLIQQYETAYHTSISGFLSRRMESNDTTDNQPYTYDFSACAPDFSGSTVTSIPHAIREVEKVASLYRAERKRVHLVSGRGLTFDSLLVLGGQSRIVHLATHGYRSPGNHEFSGWMMPGAQECIELGALQSFRMACDLLVLSSCSIGSEQGTRWYRMIRFPDNFFQAGVNNILYSLWDISDEHTDEFMCSFYSNLLDGKSYPGALRAAKFEMLSHSSTAFPTLWAVFVLWSH